MAVALAVTIVTATSWLERRGDDTDDVTSVADAGTTPRPAELPDVVELRCTPHGIEVPVASIRPRSDGLHLTIDNQLPVATEVWVTSDAWYSGRIVVAPGREDLRQPVPPGVLTVGCRIDGHEEQRQVDLVDVDGHYQQPELDCPEDEWREPNQLLPVDPPNWSRVGATTGALADYLQDDDEVEAPGGYPDEALTAPAAIPMVRVVREGRTVAFVRLFTNPAGLSEPGVHPDEEPWASARLVEACAGFLTPGGSVAGSVGGPPTSS